MMKTRIFTLLIIVIMILVLGSCTKEQNGAELIAPKELAINEGFAAYVVTTSENETFLLVENNSSTAKQTQTIWNCKCGISKEGGECNFKVKPGSPVALCIGNCNCGFTKEPLATDVVFTSKKLLVNNTTFGD